MAQQYNGGTQQNRRPASNPLEYGRSDFSEGADGHDLEIIPSSAVEAQERAQIDVQIATAKRWPRGDLRKIQDSIVQMATLDDETAASCFYTLKRKDRESGEDKVIQGPSVRLAEICVVCYKNIRAGARVIENDGRQLTAQGACHDLENNVFVSKTSTRSIVTKHGRPFSQDMQVVTANAANSIAYRNAVFGVIPGILIKKAYETCLRAAAGEGPIEHRFQKAVRMFAPWGIKEPQLLAWLEHTKAEDVKDEDIVNLRGLFNSLRDGETTVQEAFADINKDGTRKTSAAEAVANSATEQPQQQQQSAESKAEDTSLVAADSANGPGLSQEMFSSAEWEALVADWRSAHPGKNTAQMSAWIGSWAATKGELKAELHNLANQKKTQS